MNNKINKFENPIRLAELNPKDTLNKIGFKEDMVLCDIGAGSGIFSFPATEISSNLIYALEISDSMIELLESRALERKTKNLIIKKVDSQALPLDENICDMAIMVTVLHELEDKENMLSEIKRVLKDNGKLVVIEFHKRETPMGPPPDHRISEEYVEELCNSNGLKTLEKIWLSDNFYVIVFGK